MFSLRINSNAPFKYDQDVFCHEERRDGNIWIIAGALLAGQPHRVGQYAYGSE